MFRFLVILFGINLISWCEILWKFPRISAEAVCFKIFPNQKISRDFITLRSVKTHLLYFCFCKKLSHYLWCEISGRQQLLDFKKNEIVLNFLFIYLFIYLFMVWKFYENTQLPQNFGQFATGATVRHVNFPQH